MKQKAPASASAEAGAFVVWLIGHRRSLFSRFT